jgi:hypothetical protein
MLLGLVMEALARNLSRVERSGKVLIGLPFRDLAWAECLC